jgi:hypothetical protein
MALTGAMGEPHLNATKEQAVRLSGFNPGAMQVRQPRLNGLGDGGQLGRHPSKTGQLRDSGRRTKHRASRRAGALG